MPKSSWKFRLIRSNVQSYSIARPGITHDDAIQQTLTARYRLLPGPYSQVLARYNEQRHNQLTHNVDREQDLKCLILAMLEVEILRGRTLAPEAYAEFSTLFDRAVETFCPDIKSSD